jgi:hypothetical protein
VGANPANGGARSRTVREPEWKDTTTVLDPDQLTALTYVLKFVYAAVVQSPALRPSEHRPCCPR